MGFPLRISSVRGDPGREQRGAPEGALSKTCGVVPGATTDKVAGSDGHVFVHVVGMSLALPVTVPKPWPATGEGSSPGLRPVPADAWVER